MAWYGYYPTQTTRFPIRVVAPAVPELRHISRRVRVGRDERGNSFAAPTHIQPNFSSLVNPIIGFRPFGL
jgi:hypothetical protein